MHAQGFTKGQRLCSKKDFETIFSKGNSLVEFPLRFIWTTSTEQSQKELIQIAISVPKKRFKLAVDRNLLKRKIREAFRKNQSEILDSLKENKTHIRCVIVYNDTKIHSSQKIETQLKKGLKKIVSTCESV